MTRVLLGFSLVFLAVGLVACDRGGSQPASNRLEDLPKEPPVTLAKFQQCKMGMTHPQLVEILGNNGEEVSRAVSGSQELVGVIWKNPDGTNMTAGFENGKLYTISQLGLR